MKTKEKVSKAPPILLNRSARFRFEFSEEIEAGLILVGSEVKSLRQGQGNITEAYALAKQEEFFIINMQIHPYRNASQFNHEETRTRKLLLKKKQILRIKAQIETKKLSLIPLKLYFTGKGYVKILLGLGRGKKLVDKRETLKKEQIQRDIDRAFREMQRRS